MKGLGASLNFISHFGVPFGIRISNLCGGLAGGIASLGVSSDSGRFNKATGLVFTGGGFTDFIANG